VVSSRCFQHLCWMLRAVSPRSAADRSGGGAAAGSPHRRVIAIHSNMSVRSSHSTQTSAHTLLPSARHVCIFVAVMRAVTRASLRSLFRAESSLCQHLGALCLYRFSNEPRRTASHLR
jgi:hypothetical protein